MKQITSDLVLIFKIILKISAWILLNTLNKKNRKSVF